MKHFLVLLSLILGVQTLYAQEDGKLSAEEKSEVAEYLLTSWKNLENIINDLTLEQWSYKPADTIWSIAEISEHLERSEKELFSLVSDRLMQSPAMPEKVHEMEGKREFVQKAVTSRDNKIKTRPELEPIGNYPTPQAFLESFGRLREETMTYTQSTEDALRHHFVPFGALGELDGYQILMFMSGHLERHYQQIQEVMQDPNYPPA